MPKDSGVIIAVMMEAFNFSEASVNIYTMQHPRKVIFILVAVRT
jgi:hypothetical protein